MTTYPVYDCSRYDYDCNSHPIGRATTEAHAKDMLESWFANTNAGPFDVVLADRDTKGRQLWAWWCEPIN